MFAGAQAFFMHNEQLQSLVERCVERRGGHVIDIFLRGSHHRTLLEVYIDAEAGVTTELCSEVSRDITAALKQQPLLDPLFQLTVSSPGIDRSLIFPWQYKKHAGREMRILTGSGVETAELTGVLVSVDELGVTLEVGEKGEQQHIPFDTIRKAYVLAPW